MNEHELKKLLENNSEVDIRINEHLKKQRLFRQQPDMNEIEGHIAKSKHNLNFADDTKYSDWVLVGCYYAAYHMALALIMTKGYYSKNHDATLCVLVRHFHLLQDELILLNSIALDTQDILFYVEAKNKREEASYLTQTSFDKNTINSIKLKTILFINKANEIIDNSM